LVKDFYFILFYYYFGTEGCEANAKAQDADDHLASFSSGREEISLLGIDLPTSSLIVWYLSTIIR
jgi:hypothetical protein